MRARTRMKPKRGVNDSTTPLNPCMKLYGKRRAHARSVTEGWRTICTCAGSGARWRVSSVCARANAPQHGGGCRRIPSSSPSPDRLARVRLQNQRNGTRIVCVCVCACVCVGLSCGAEGARQGCAPLVDVLLRSVVRVLELFHIRRSIDACAYRLIATARRASAAICWMVRN